MSLTKEQLDELLFAVDAIERDGFGKRTAAELRLAIAMARVAEPARELVTCCGRCGGTGDYFGRGPCDGCSDTRAALGAAGMPVEMNR